MQKPVFSIDKTRNRDIITTAGTNLTISVYYLEEEPFEPTPGETVFYGDDHGAYIAFETTGWNPEADTEHLELVGLALMWYAKILDYPQMQLSIEDPRPVPPYLVN
jgi:hypothetical protein